MGLGLTPTCSIFVTTTLILLVSIVKVIFSNNEYHCNKISHHLCVAFLKLDSYLKKE